MDSHIKKEVSRLWGGLFSKQPEKEIRDFLSGRDVTGLPPADEILLPYDLEASKAHCRMLEKTELLTKDEADKLISGLELIGQLYKEGKFHIDPTKEDVHTNIESFLIDKYGIELGGKIHTARSRNDQIIVATRLFLKNAVTQFVKGLDNLITILNNKVHIYRDAAIPGYTHHQKAMPTTFNDVLLSFVAMLNRDKMKFSQWLEVWDKNPLGAMAGYGTSFNINRNYSGKLLGFSQIEDNTIDTVTCRWEPEADFVYYVCSTMNHLSILAQTFILFSTEEFGYIKLDEKYLTGSSIMPQKKNPDALEVIKAKAGWVSGQLMSLLSIGKANMIGYNRDTQWTKYIIIDVIRECLPSLSVVGGLVETMIVNTNRMKTATKTGNLYSTALVEKLVKEKGLSLRQAKIQVEQMIKEGTYKE